MDREQLTKIVQKADSLKNGKELAYAKEFISIDDKVNNLDTKLTDIADELKKKLEEELSYEIDPEEIRGEKGEDGIDGTDGVDGKDGKDGKDGTNGKDGKNGLDGKDGNDGIDGKDGKDGSPDTGEDIVNKINELPLDKDKQIDASHIKNLPKTINNITGGVVARNIHQLGDVVLTSLQNDQVLKYNSARNLWLNATDTAGTTTSIAKQGSTALTGAVTLTGSGDVTLSQVGQNIDINATFTPFSLTSGSGTTANGTTLDLGGVLTSNVNIDGGSTYETIFTNSTHFGVGDGTYDPSGGGLRGFLGFDSGLGMAWIGDIRGGNRNTYVSADDMGSFGARNITLNAPNSEIRLYTSGTPASSSGYVWTLTDNATGAGEWMAKLPIFSSGSVIFSNGTDLVEDNANFFWDNPNNRLGIGTTTPATALDVIGAGQFSTNVTIKGVAGSGLYFGDATTYGHYSGVYGSNGGNDINIKGYASSTIHLGFGTSTGQDLTALEAMTIKSTGNVGINNTSPAERLDILGNTLLTKTGTATVGTQTYNSNEYKLQGSQWFTSGSVAKTLTGGMTIKPRNPGAIVTSTLDFGYAIDSSTERPVISYKVGDHYNDGFAGQLTLRSGYWDGIGSFATGYGSAFGGMIETQYDGTFAFRPVGGSGTTFSGMRALSFGTHPTYASFWSRWGYGGGTNYSADIRTSFNGQVNIGAGLPDWISAGTGASGAELLNVTIDQVITGNDATRPALKIVKTTEQVRIGYDSSNYFKTTVGSTGSTTFDLVGTSPVFTFSDPVTFSDTVTIADGKNIVLNTTTGTKIGTATTQKLAFYNSTPIVKPTALTTQLTTITATAPGTPDYAIQDLTNVAGYGFVTADEGQSVLKVILNLQTRVAELETKLQALGLIS